MSERFEKCREALETILVPMLDAEVGEVATESAARVAWHEGQTQIKLKPEDSTRRLVLSRAQPFSDSEKALAAAFLDEWLDICELDDRHYRQLLRTVPERITAASLSRQHPSAVQSIIEVLSEWASETYEGDPIVGAIGFDPNGDPGSCTLAQAAREDFGKVLTNGFDTILIVNADLEVVRHEQFQPPADPPPNAPYRLASFASWTSESEGRCVLVVNRQAEIIALQDGKLLFARRKGLWTHYVHDSAIKKLVPPQARPVRAAIYSTCLDVSFARAGGGFAVARVGTTDAEIWGPGGPVAPTDVLTEGRSVKAKTLATLVEGRVFQDLDRRLRLELLSIDGATVLRHDGEIIAVGAIVKLPAGSEGGGRHAAAVALSHLGLGIKIGEDGAIAAFKDADLVLSA